MAHSASEKKETAPRVSMNEVSKQYALYEHKESNVKIYFTKNYAMFGKMAGNRVLNKIKIARIKRDIAGGLDVLKYCPIIVAAKGGKLEILDGQHRYVVAKELSSHVWYIIAEELSILEIARVNSNTEKWKPADYIHVYTSQGNEDYKKLKEFMEAYRFPLSVSIQMLMKGNALNDGGPPIGKEALNGGQFKVVCADQAEEVAKIVMEFGDFSYCRQRVFIVAICKIITAEKMPIAEVIEAYKENKGRLEYHSSWKDYLANLEAIVNIGKKVRRVIF